MAPPIPSNLAAPAPAPVVSISKIWPDGATPTKVIHIPDAQMSTKGLMQIDLHHGDDLEIDIDPLWYFVFPSQGDSFPKTQAAINEGEGFETLNEYVHRRVLSGTNADFMKSRVYRLRTASAFQESSFSLPVVKGRKVPDLQPAIYGDLSITYGGMQTIADQGTAIFLSFHNKSQINTIAVAMYDEIGNAAPFAVRCSLITSEGTKYTLNTTNLYGIKGARVNPRNLTPIPPGSDLQVLLAFQSTGELPDSINSLRLWAALLVNLYWNPNDNNSYRTQRTEDRPPNCGLIDVTFNIPLQ